MRPLDVSYGQAMLDYLNEVHPDGDKSIMPFFDYGHPVEMANKLKLKEKDSDDKNNKYPLIYLRTDFEEQERDMVWTYRLTIYLIAYTDLQYSSQERKEKVFSRVLYPLYERFIEELGRQSIFQFTTNNEQPNHTKIDRFFWGNELNLNNTEKIFDDPLDAIEITSLELEQIDRKC